MNLFNALFFLFVSTTFYKTVFAIIDGQLVGNIEHYKYMVGFQLNIDQNHSSHFCSGIIISERKILSVAHCLHQGNSFTLKFGALKLDKPHYTLDITNKDFTIHPEYSGGDPYHNDIAVVELETPLIFGPKIGKINMIDYRIIDKNYASEGGNTVTMLGYTESDGRDRNMTVSPLKSIDATTAEFFQCQTLVYEQHMDRLIQKDREFCVNLHKGQRHNTNQGDSGGPVIIKKRKHYLLGLISYDFWNMPEICTLISGHTEFIADPRSYVSRYSRKREAVWSIEDEGLLIW
ncbi:granzyme K-like [Contarinia nasturtii]|uniref:granzyme K-like n=1 Tax=Contarinia nasturtii TaxID=265458 RepID=UPI0012D4B8D8|nr:granzyme K-like [Contarinia nasturtii]